MKSHTPQAQVANTKKNRTTSGRSGRSGGVSTARTGRSRSRWLIPDDVADTIVAEMRELENAAHE